MASTVVLCWFQMERVPQGINEFSDADETALCERQVFSKKFLKDGGGRNIKHFVF